MRCLTPFLPLSVLLAFACPVQAQLPATPGELLARIDLDGDGRVGREEYRAWMSRGFRAMDTNGDGTLQPSELPPGTRFRGRSALTLADLYAQLDARFDLQDAGGDGYLDAQELAAPPR